MLLLGIHTLLLAASAWVHSPTWDEWGHLPAGISHWQLGQFDLYRVNPPLVRMVAALPVLAYAPQIPWPGTPADPRARRGWESAERMVQAHGPQVLWWFTLARWACIPFSLLGAWICFRWAGELYGSRAGLTAAALWCFSPTILGHAPMITPDVGAAAVGAAAGYLFWRWLKEPSFAGAVAAGLVLGLAQLTKFTWVILFGLWPLLWLVWRIGTRRASWLRESAQVGLMIVVAVYAMNLGYAFEGTGARLDDLRFISPALRDSPGVLQPGSIPRPGNRFAGSLWGRLPIPVPANYLLGIDRQKYDFDEAGFWSYLRGQWRQGGWWYYYLYALAIKEPLGTWLLALLAIAAPIGAPGGTAKRRDELLLLAPTAAVLLLVSSQTGFNHHMRYVLPMFPLAYIWISRVARDSEHRTSLFRLLVLVAVVWSVGSSLRQYPHSLAYFNEAVGGPRRGHEHLLDSNIDWGQDLLLLKRWLDRHPHVQPIAVAHQFPPWMRDAADIRIPPISVPAGPSPDNGSPASPENIGPLPGWYAVFVQQLRARHGRYEYFLRFRPAATVGYTVYVYHISVDQANRVRRDLGLPETDPPRASRCTARRTAKQPGGQASVPSVSSCSNHIDGGLRPRSLRPICHVPYLLCHGSRWESIRTGGNRGNAERRDCFAGPDVSDCSLHQLLPPVPR